MVGLLFDDTPLPKEQKRRARLLRIVPVWIEGFASSSVQRYFGVVTVDGVDRPFRVEADDAFADLAIAQPGDELDIGASSFDGETLHLRSARIVWSEGMPDFQAIMDNVSGVTNAKAVVWRTGQYVRKEYGKLKSVVRLALYVETPHVQGVITVSVGPDGDFSSLVACVPGDQLAVAFEMTTYAPRKPYLKKVSVTQFVKPLLEK